MSNHIKSVELSDRARALESVALAARAVIDEWRGKSQSVPMRPCLIHLMNELSSEVSALREPSGGYTAFIG